ncbi:radical SAM protein, partial [bacterium]|nr:radical SAM protein [bacterium]
MAVPKAGYTVGIGLTDRCNATCPHCYSRPQGEHHDMDYDELCNLFDKIPLKSVNFGTGESILYPRFIEVVEMLVQRGVEVAVTTNGSTIMDLPDDIVRLFHDVDFSLDYADPKMNDRWRGVGSYEAVMKGIDKCRRLGVEVSMVACLMSANAEYLGQLAKSATEWDLNLRVNVYKAVTSDEFRPTYEQFWSAISDMADAAYFCACSEPVVSAAIGHRNGSNGNPCGQSSFRVHPDGIIVPCVYLLSSPVTLADATENFEECLPRLSNLLDLPLPEPCRECEWKEVCQGGCASRRLLKGKAEPDEYCFIIRHDKPQINARWRKSKGL